MRTRILLSIIPLLAIGEGLSTHSTAGEVLFDNELAVQEALELLAGLGHRRIAVLSWLLPDAPGRSSERAVRRIARSVRHAGANLLG